MRLNATGQTLHFEIGDRIWVNRKHTGMISSTDKNKSILLDLNNYCIVIDVNDKYKIQYEFEDCTYECWINQFCIDYTRTMMRANNIKACPSFYAKLYDEFNAFVENELSPFIKNLYHEKLSKSQCFSYDPFRTRIDNYDGIHKLVLAFYDSHSEDTETICINISDLDYNDWKERLINIYKEEQEKEQKLKENKERIEQKNKEMIEKSERIDRYNKLMELNKEFRDFPLNQKEIEIINNQSK